MERRFFLKTGALATGSLMVPLPLLAQESKIKLGIVGCGWWASDFLMPNILSSGLYEIVGLCDVNSLALNQSADKVVEAGGARPALFASYKEMYEMQGLQAVVIATPTHWHALQFIDACEKGLHVFLEKPISYDIREGQSMMEAKKKAGIVVQVDFPRTMVDVNEQVRQYINSGAAGEIKQVKANIISGEGPLFEKAIPQTMDFENFTGPAPRQKYMSNKKGNNPKWRSQFAFSRGIMNDWGIHYIHNIRQVLNLDLPLSVSAIGGNTSDYPRENPDHLDARFDFDGLPVYWSHKTWGYKAPDPEHNIGVYYYGKKATIFAGDLGWWVYPGDGSETIKNGDVRFNPGAPENQSAYKKMFEDMFLEFARGIRNNSEQGITNTMEDAQKTTSSVIFADMAYRTQSHLEIEASGLNIRDNEEAEARLKREYRSPYSHPYSG